MIQPKTNSPKKIDDSQTVVMVGSHTRQKRPELFVAAAARVAADLPNIRFLLIGRFTEYTELLRQMVIEAGLEHSFQINDYTSRAAHDIARAALLVAPAVEEGHGRTLIEAMLLNTPVAASRSGGHLEIVKDGTNGRLFEVDDPTSMADVIINILSNPNNTSAMIRKLQFAKRDFTVKNTHGLHRYISTIGIKMTKSVVFTIESMGGGGAQIVMLHLINGLLEKGLRVHLITTQAQRLTSLTCQRTLNVMCWAEQGDPPTPYLPFSQIFAVF